MSKCTDPLESALRLHYTRMKYYHKKHKGGSDNNFLSYETYRKIIQQPCHYCGCEPKHPLTNYKGEVVGYRQTIDRVDSSLGYTEVGDFCNCVPCCSWCNVSKSDLSTEDFYKMIKKVYDHCGLEDSK